MEMPSYFEKFLRDIRPTSRQIEDYKCGHTTLRERLKNDVELKPILVDTFLQGSYRRATAVRPRKGKRPDVDVIVVTRLHRDEYPDPDGALDLFVPFLDRHYKGKYRRQGRSFGIELSYVDLDLVITSAPSEAEEHVYESKAATTYETPEDAPDWRLVKSWIPVSERDSTAARLMEAARKEAEWKTEPLWIPNRDAGEWERTHPLEQIKWTWGKNARCNAHYVNVVKAIKWWRRVNCEDLERPKGYPLEHLVGVCCIDSIQSVAQGVTLTLEAVVRDYGYYAERFTVPFLADHGVPEHNVFARVSGEDFAQFYDYVAYAAKVAREAYDAETVSASAEKWRKLFGSKFPPAGDDNDGKDIDDPRGPFIAPSLKSQTGDLTPRRWG